jgi:glutamate-ammonia-ligase adenylyltransferase
MAIVAMGRYGGFELSYGSDADVMFVHEPDDGAGEDATAYAHAVANELRRLLVVPATDPPLVIDADLRPEGKQGPLVRTLASYAAYYAKWSKVWEAQALLRADAVVGDDGVRAAFTELVDPLRYPDAGITDADITEIRRVKARVDRERLPRGADPHTHLKLGRGGLADIEWTVQLLQLRYAGQVAALRSPRTLTALAAARDAGLVCEADHDALAKAWHTVSRLRNAITLVTGRTGDQIPRDSRERAAVASILGYGAGHSDELVNDYLRTTRHARGVVDRVFWE